MTSPQATIRYIDDLQRRTNAEVTIQCEHSIELTLLVMRRCRELNGDGALILWVEFLVDGQTRRHYPSGRRAQGAVRKYR